MKDPLYMGSSLGIIPPIFTPPLEPFDGRALRSWGCFFLVPCLLTGIHEVDVGNRVVDVDARGGDGTTPGLTLG